METPESSLPGTSSPPSTSLGARLMNVIATPGEVFEEIAGKPESTANWLTPVLLACLVGVIGVWTIFAQPAIQQQLKDQQEKQIQKMKIPPAQLENARAAMEKFTIISAKVGGTVGVVAYNFAGVFLVGLVLWLLGTQVFKESFTYLKAVEVAGLSAMISVLNSVVTTLLMVGTGSLYAKLGPSLFITEFDPTNLAHTLMASVNLLSLWYVGVVALGLSKLSAVSFGKAAGWLYGLWLVLNAGMVTASWLVVRAFTPS